MDALDVVEHVQQDVLGVHMAVRVVALYVQVVVEQSVPDVIQDVMDHVTLTAMEHAE